MPDGSKGRKGGVVILSAEDDLSDTLHPRLEAAGADLSRIEVLVGVRGKGPTQEVYNWKQILSPDNFFWRE